MALTGRQKAAMLISSLDVETATELLRGFDPTLVQDLAVELSYLDATGLRDAEQGVAVSQEFCQALDAKPEFQLNEFLDGMLKGAVGGDRAHQIQGQITGLLKKRDPFLAVRTAELATLAEVLETEHPQAVAVILSELPPKRSSELLSMLSGGVRLSAINRMTGIANVTPDARAKIAQIVSTKIEALSAPSGAGGVVVARKKASPEEALRQIAVIMRNMDRDIRDSVLMSVREKDREAAEAVADLMVIWEDIPEIQDRSMQAGLRGLSESQLALSLVEADGAIAKKIKSNVSERAAAMIDEEASLMSSPKKEEIQEARKKILYALRELNRNGELTFGG